MSEQSDIQASAVVSESVEQPAAAVTEVVSGGEALPPSVAAASALPLPPSPTSGGPGFGSKRPCSFFAMGTCRNGTNCRFSHDLSAPTQMPTQPPHPAPFITIPPGHPVYSIDVECVATSIQHNARSIAQVALVDEWSRPVFNVVIKQDVPVASYITPLTGLTKEILDAHGYPLGMLGLRVIVAFVIVATFLLLSQHFIRNARDTST